VLGEASAVVPTADASASAEIQSAVAAVSKGEETAAPAAGEAAEAAEAVVAGEETPARAAPRIILLGPPAGGKGKQIELLLQTFNVAHLSPGVVLREVSQAGTQLGNEIKEAIQSRTPMPDHLTIQALKHKIASAEITQHGFLLDGYPRTVEQARMLLQLAVPIDKVILVHSSQQALIDRLSSRWLDPETGTFYDLRSNAPTNEDIAARLIQREEDQEPVIRARLEAFYKNIDEIESVMGHLFVKIDGDQDQAKVFEDIQASIMTAPAAPVESSSAEAAEAPVEAEAQPAQAAAEQATPSVEDSVATSREAEAGAGAVAAGGSAEDAVKAVAATVAANAPTEQAQTAVQGLAAAVGTSTVLGEASAVVPTADASASAETQSAVAAVSKGEETAAPAAGEAAEAVVAGEETASKHVHVSSGSRDLLHALTHHLPNPFAAPVLTPSASSFKEGKLVIMHAFEMNESMSLRGCVCSSTAQSLCGARTDSSSVCSSSSSRGSCRGHGVAISCRNISTYRGS
jgi:adenylate kinase